MTSEQAADKAAQILEQAHSQAPHNQEHAAVLVAIADGWTRLCATLLARDALPQRQD